MAHCTINNVAEQTTKRYFVEVTPRGLVVDFGEDFKITSSVLDGPLKYNDFDDSQLESIVLAENFAQPIHKEIGPRINSGLYQFSHIVRGLYALSEFSKQAGHLPDFIISHAFTGHDNAELHEMVMAAYDKWEAAVIKGDEQAIRLSKSGLELARIQVRDSMNEMLLGGNNVAIGGKLRQDISTSNRIVYEVTRFKDELSYAHSMGYQFTRKGNESLINTLRRFNVKGIDRIVNLEEYGPLYLPHIMEQGIMAFDDKSRVGGYVVGEELTRRFGGMRGDGVNMSPSLMVANAFNSFFPLEYFNETFNKYGETIEAIDVAKISRVTKLVKTKMTEGALEVLNKAIDSYESEWYILNRKEEVEQEILKNKNSRFYFEVEENGFVSDWLYRELGGRYSVGRLDDTPEGRFYAYRTARHLREVFSMFNMFYERGNIDSDGRPNLIKDPGILFDPTKHAYFTLGGVDKALEPLSGREFREAVSKLKGQTL